MLIVSSFAASDCKDNCPSYFINTQQLHGTPPLVYAQLIYLLFSPHHLIHHRRIALDDLDYLRRYILVHIVRY